MIRVRVPRGDSLPTVVASEVSSEGGSEVETNEQKFGGEGTLILDGTSRDEDSIELFWTQVSHGSSEDTH